MWRPSAASRTRIQISERSIARRPGGIRDDQPLLAKEPVDQRRFADVRAADDCYAQRVWNFLGDLRNSLHQDVEHVARVLSVESRDRNGITGAQFIELEKVGRAGVIDFVGNEHPGLPCLAQDLDHPGVTRMQPRLGIDDQHQQIGFVNGLKNLTLDFEVHRYTRIIGQAAGVNQPELSAVPFRSGKVSVAGRAGFFADDGVVLAYNAVEQRRLANVGATDERDDREVHAATPTSSDARTSMKS